MTTNIPSKTLFAPVIFQRGGFCGGNWPHCGGEYVEKRILMCVTEKNLWYHQGLPEQPQGRGGKLSHIKVGGDVMWRCFSSGLCGNEVICTAHLLSESHPNVLYVHTISSNMAVSWINIAKYNSTYICLFFNKSKSKG